MPRKTLKIWNWKKPRRKPKPCWKPNPAAPWPTPALKFAALPQPQAIPNALRVLGWALWHRAVRDHSRSDDLAKAEKYLRDAMAIPPIFPAFASGPVLVALIPVLLYRGELDEAEICRRYAEVY